MDIEKTEDFDDKDDLSVEDQERVEAWEPADADLPHGDGEQA